jgi:phosphoribosylglycinamide formyltransferase-1
VHDLVNLAVDLRSDRFNAENCARAVESISAAGFSVERLQSGPDPFLAWIDMEFGGAWSSEALAGKNLIVRSGRRYAAFATYDPQGVSYAWLRGAAQEPGTGVFGPFGVAPEFRGSPLGENVLVATLCALREAGYARALIPAVGEGALVQYYARACDAEVVERFDGAHFTSKRYRTVVLASGNGSNFQSVIDGVAAGDIPLDLALLLTNRANAYALERAGIAGVAHVAFPWDRKAQSRAEYDRALLEIVRREEPDLLLLLGWMHVLDDVFVAAHPHTINIHPAFLPLDQRRDEVGFPDGSVTPAFRGAHAVRDALAWGSRWVGASCHRVTLEADRGPVLTRKPLAIAPGETEEAILDRLHPLEHRVLAGGIRRWVFER